MTDITVNTFEKGINTDDAFSVLPSNSYIDGKNIDISSYDGQTNYNIENILGNYLMTNITNSYRIVGYCALETDLILFITTNINEITPTAGVSKILKLKISNNKVIETVTIYQDDSSKGYLKFSTVYPIKTKYVYENEERVIVYFTDNYNNIRFVNVSDTTGNVYNQTVDKFEFISNMFYSGSSLVRPKFDSVINGNMTPRVVQYTYQLYTEGGAATNYAPLSPQIPVLIQDSSHRIFREGRYKDENIGGGLKMKFSIEANNTYNRVRLIALDTFAYGEAPSVRIIDEVKLATNNSSSYYIYISDVGDSISTMPYDDFLIPDSYLFKAKDIDISQNYLLASNITEEVFDVDFDAKAYRFDTTLKARVYDNDLTTYNDITTSNWETLPDNLDETYGYINRYNDSAYEADASYQYIYQSDGTTLGAEGPNVKISFRTYSGILDYSPTVYTIYNDNTSSPLLESNITTYRNFQRLEVYRIGLIFFNEKQQASSVKWMCDLKMPGNVDYPYSSYSYSTSNTHWVALGLKVTLKSSFPTGAVAWQVVMVPRKKEDRSILGMGIIQTTKAGSDKYSPETALLSETDVSTTATYDRNALMFITPEINFNNNIDYKTGDFIQYIGSYAIVEPTSGSVTGFYGDTIGTNTTYGAYKLDKYTAAGDDYLGMNIGSKITLTSAAKCGYATGVQKDVGVLWNKILSLWIPNAEFGLDDPLNQVGDINFGTVTGTNKSFASTDITVYEARHGSYLGLIGTNTPSILDTTTQTKVPMGYYRRDAFDYQYGGPDYYARSLNEYIPCSNISFSDSGSYINTWEGDTYIQMFVYGKTFVDFTSQTSKVDIIFPVESSMPIGLRHDQPHYKHPSSITNQMEQEIAGEYEFNYGSVTTYEYYQSTDLYQLNTVYAQYPNGVFYYPKKLDESDNYKYPNKVIRSEKKINGELIDSFTKFKPNNYIEVNPNHGEIYNIMTTPQGLLFWQKNAFGIISINQRSLVQDNNIGTLQLGTGGVLERFDYLSEYYGNSNINGILKSPSGVYWFDNINMMMLRWNGKVEPLSRSKKFFKGVSSSGQVGNFIIGNNTKKNHIYGSFIFNRLATIFTYDSYQIFVTLDDTTDLTVTSGTKYDVMVDGIRTVMTATGTNYWTIPLPEKNGSGKVNVAILSDPLYTKTILYNEKEDCLTSLNISLPTQLYIVTKDDMITSNNLYQIYSHNDTSVERGTFFGTTCDCYITIVVNKDYPLTKVFDNINYVSTSIDANNNNVFGDTFNHIHFWNDYQNTGERQVITTGTPTTSQILLGRRERSWTLAVPRNIVDTDVSADPPPDIFSDTTPTLTNKERIRDKYMISKYIYDNDNNYKLSCPFIATQFRKSIR